MTIWHRVYWIACGVALGGAVAGAFAGRWSAVAMGIASACVVGYSALQSERDGGRP